MAESGPSEPSETRVGYWVEDDCDVYAGRGDNGRHMLMVGRPGKRGWLGNPFSVDDYGRTTAIEKYREVFEDKLRRDKTFRAAVEALAGQTLGCWCQRLDEDGPACHAEVVAEWADRLATNDWADVEDQANAI